LRDDALGVCTTGSSSLLKQQSGSDVNHQRAALALLLGTLLLLATGTGRTAPRAAAADTILVNGHVLTVDPQDTVADAVAIRDGKILAVGSNEAVRALAGPDSHVIDLHGRTATPGLIDAHAHIADGGVQSLYSVELGDATDIAEVKRRVAARVSALKPGQWLFGHGWDEGKLSEGRYIFASDLDDIAPANPVWLEHTTGHYGAANRAALKLAGISASTSNPTAGTIDRDGSGQPTGVLKEAAADLVRRVVPEWSIEQERQSHAPRRHDWSQRPEYFRRTVGCLPEARRRGQTLGARVRTVAHRSKRRIGTAHGCPIEAFTETASSRKGESGFVRRQAIHGWERRRAHRVDV
jgi:hypothetical protein